MMSPILNRKFSKNSFLLFSFFFGWAFIYRTLLGYFSVRDQVDDFWLITLSIFKQDALIFAALLFLYVISSIIHVKSLTTVLRLIIVGTFLLYCLDLAALLIFHTRLSFNDLFQYLPDITFLPGLFIFSIYTGLLFFIVFILFGLSSIVFIHHQGPKNPKISGLILIVAFAATGFHFSGKSDAHLVHSWISRNFIEINLGKGLNTPYSEEFIKTTLKRGVDEETVCIKKTMQMPQKNMILLILESFSMHHSQFFSGINDYTPNLDKLASQGRTFTNFIANGFSTTHGLIALLTGRFPIPGTKESQYHFLDNYKGYYNLDHTLPKILTRSGYYSEFLTTGNLGFSNKGEWLENIGFDHFEGHDTDHYKGHKRLHYQSVPDALLYERVLDRLKLIEEKAPYFMAIETVSTHLPFIDPITEERSESLAVRYADKALGKFYDELSQTGFFDNGILIIVSDHRSMNMVTLEEIELFGSKAPALVPLVIIGPEYNGIEENLFQQTDIFNSIKNYISKASCTSKFKGDLLSTTSTPPEYAIYVRGDDRSLINIFDKNKTATIRLEGDQTRIIDGGEFEDGSYAVRKINYDRILKGSFRN